MTVFSIRKNSLAVQTASGLLVCNPTVRDQDTVGTEITRGYRDHIHSVVTGRRSSQAELQPRMLTLV